MKETEKERGEREQMGKRKELQSVGVISILQEYRTRSVKLFTRATSIGVVGVPPSSRFKRRE